MPKKKLDAFEARGQVYTHNVPRLINTVVYPDGTCIHMAGMNLGPFALGIGPVYAEGVRVESWADDGSQEWANLYAQVLQQPVRDRWSVA